MRFVELDQDLLRERYRVTGLYLESMRVNPISILRQVRKHDLVFAWFASWHSLLPLLFARLLDKPSILVIGGYDLACMPEVDYGLQQGGLPKWVSRGAMRLATQLMTNSYYSRKEAVENAGLDGDDIAVAYHGLDAGHFPVSTAKEPMAITVGNVVHKNLGRKGLEAFVRAARHLPEVPFVLIGRWRDEEAAEYLTQVAPSNVRLTGFVPDEDLLDLYQRAQVYVQPSAHEGFGLSVAEAMLCGCIPVVTRAGALPEVVGDAGVYVPSRDPEAVAEGVEAALNLDGDRGSQARRRVMEKFPLVNRRQALFEIVESVLMEGDEEGRNECQ
jgi:glycosyltransferase involved in cell wall biosynthesis